MKHNHLNYKQSHKYVSEQASNGKDVFWDGWDIVIFKKNPSGYMVKNGMYRNGQWGTTRRIKVSERGTWRLPVTP